MRLARPFGLSHHAITPLLKCPTSQTSTRAFSQSILHYERYTPPQYEPRPQPNPTAKNVAVLGGGITGLTTAYYLTKIIPNANITIYEGSSRLGGWINSETIEVEDGKTVLFEWGPRSLRPDVNGPGLTTLNLILDLDFEQSALNIHKQAAASVNRFLYFPDHLVRMPGPDPKKGRIRQIYDIFSTMISEPIFRGVVRGLLAEPAVTVRPGNMSDESVGDFLTRRFGPALTDNIASAFFHGIYAGDLYKLSARTLLPSLWYMEKRDPSGNGILLEFVELAFRQQVLKSSESVNYHNMTINDASHRHAFKQAYHDMMRQASMYTFCGGLEQLSGRIEQSLKENSNVTIMTDSPVSAVNFDDRSKTSKVSVAGTSQPQQYDYVVSSLPPDNTLEFLKQSAESRDKTVSSSAEKALVKSRTAVDVMVVNLYYSNPELNIPPGFGYLIPRSIPTEQNPERALGVIFSSESSGCRGKNQFIQGLVAPKDGNGPPVEQRIQAGQDSAEGTKLTVMLGGHWWDGWTETDLPSESEGIEMAKSVLARHLKIFEQPFAAKAKLNRKAIPQYHVGYRKTMATVHEALLSEYGGRFKVAGPWWQGAVGVNDSIKKARQTVMAIREGWDHATGLEHYGEDEKYSLYNYRLGSAEPDPLKKS